MNSKNTIFSLILCLILMGCASKSISSEEVNTSETPTDICQQSNLTPDQKEACDPINDNKDIKSYDPELDNEAE